MGKVPVYRNKRKFLGRISQIIPVVGTVPRPTGEVSFPGGITQCDSFVGSDVWDEVRREADVVCALPSDRFSRFLGEQAVLPRRVAECLEDFETGLRSAGLIAVDQMIVQSFDDPRKFRVQKRKVVEDGTHVMRPLYRQKRRLRRSLF